MAASTTPPPSNEAHQNTGADSDRLSETKIPAECIEKVVASPHGVYIPPEEIQGRFELLRDLSPERMVELNKNVVSKIDWHMMPCVTVMFLMK